MLQEEFELIENYIEGTLDSNSLIAFEKRLTEDSELLERVEEQRILRRAIQEENLREKLNGFHKELSESTESASNKVRTFTPYVRYAAAACIALLLFWGGFKYLKGVDANQAQNEQLFAAHFTPDPGLPTTMSASNNYEFFNAMVSYKQGDYQKAIGVWETLLKEKPSNDTLNYFIGVAHLANDNEEEAISFLQWAAEHPESKFYKEVYHYLGLAHLKNGDKENALVTLKKSQLQKSDDLLKELLSEK